ncbi:O-antigen ligase family protein [Flagellimonas maritima]|uniref:O-antigen ligase family protein n=1 Tax=Flagellimonas maritima TaxID=1383885 RepID=UPI0013DF45A6|nr:O-antigen ligase family protein [Allomuricauda aurantiaca]
MILKGIKWNILLLSTVPLFILHLFGAIYTDYSSDSFHYLEKTISFLLVPLVFIYFCPLELRKIKGMLLKGLFYGSIVSILYLTAFNLYRYFSSQDSLHIGYDILGYYHTYIHFTRPIDQHPTYLGVYYLTALLFLKHINLKKQIKNLAIILLCLGILLVNSRVVFIGLFILVFFKALQKALKYIRLKKIKKLVLFTVVFGGILILSINIISSTYIGDRFINIARFEMLTTPEGKVNSRTHSNPRFSRYISAFKLIKEKPIIGYGVADEYPRLKEQFKKDGLFYAAEEGYNAHNQFIGFAIRFGAIGLLVLSFFLISNIRLAIVTKEFNYALLGLIITCVSLTENYFDRNFGITFIAMFFTVFLYSIFPKKHITLLERSKESISLF